MPENGPSLPMPPLPDAIDPAGLQALDDAALDAAAAALTAAERATRAVMAPYDRQLREIRARAAEIATDRRRRERAAHIAARRGVREAASSGEMPTLEAALAAPTTPIGDAVQLDQLPVFLATGGEVRLGFATRPGRLVLTDGRQQRQAATWGEARELYLAGWEPGAPQLPGVRVHLAGSRVEKVVASSELVVGTPS